MRSKVKLPDDFPSRIVEEAYLHPQVDESREHFAWGMPDLEGLRRYALKTILVVCHCGSNVVCEDSLQ